MLRNLGNTWYLRKFLSFSLSYKGYTNTQKTSNVSTGSIICIKLLLLYVSILFSKKANNSAEIPNINEAIFTIVYPFW